MYKLINLISALFEYKSKYINLLLNETICTKSDTHIYKCMTHK